MSSIKSVANGPVMVEVTDVSKRFVVRKDKSMKERIVNVGRGKRHRIDFWALRDVTATITAGTTVGLVGANGSGKSTLLKVIGGIIQPSSGHVRRRGRLAALLELGAGFHPDLTGRENIYLNASILGLTRAQTDEYFDSIVEFSEIPDFIDTQVKFYSSGMYVRLAFSIAIHVDPDVLLIDEVLAVGDEAFQRKCMAKIREYQKAGKTIIFVSHSLAQVGELCDRVIVMNQGRVEFDGDTAEGIRILRDGFAERHVPSVHPVVEEGSEELSPSVMELVGLRVDTGNPDHHAERGQSIDVIVDVEAQAVRDDWRVGVEIETPLGQIIWATDTERLGIMRESVEGTLSMHLRLRDVQLAEGQYTVSAGLGTDEHGEVSRINQGARFTVVGNSPHVGLVHIDADAEFSLI